MGSVGAAYSVLAGNHDVSGDDTRGSTPYLTTMGPQRFKKSKTFAGSDSSGYNTALICSRRGSRVATARARLADVLERLGLGEPVHQGQPVTAGHPHHAQGASR